MIKIIEVMKSNMIKHYRTMDALTRWNRSVNMVDRLSDSQ